MAVAANAGNPPAAQGNLLFSILQMILMYYAFSYFMKPKPAVVTDAQGNQVQALPHRNLWPDKQRFELYVYASIHEHFEEEPEKNECLIWEQKNLVFNWDEANNQEKNITIPVTDHLIFNGSLFAHVYFVKKGYSISSHQANPEAVLYRKTQLNVYRQKKKISVKKNLISGQYADERVHAEVSGTDIAEENKRVAILKNAPVEIVSYFKPTLTVRLLHDFTVFPKNGIPPQVSEHFQFIGDNYLPVIYIDDFWVRAENLIQVNNTVKELFLLVSYSPISMFKWQIQISMEQSWKMQESWGAHTDADSDEIKRIMTETDPYLLGITVVVSVLHSIFDFLAFKNDIQFWRKNESVEGLSVRTIFINAFCQLVILLYLIDQDTTWMVMISSMIGLGIEVWKIYKAADVKITWNGSIPIHISIQDKISYSGNKTKEYDREAMYYLSFAFYPLAIGYAIYSLYYNEHTGYYSFILSTMVSFIYTFGFIMMCPQLYLNYKLKSVAHLPWRMLTYKFLNTFIDDLFAFIIKMPTMHRLSCFRDDIIFFVYIYQRWMYSVDLTRTNEFGFVLIVFPLLYANRLTPEPQPVVGENVEGAITDSSLVKSVVSEENAISESCASSNASNSEGDLVSNIAKEDLVCNNAKVDSILPDSESSDFDSNLTQAYKR